MPGKLYYLEDRRIHYVSGFDFVELSVLPIDTGPWLVVAKGTVRDVNAPCRVEFALRVHAMFSGLIGFDETASVVEGGDSQSFMLTVAAKVPSEGGAGSFSLPPHRAVLLARKDSSFAAAEARVTNVKITSYPLDEIVATVLT